MKKFLVIFVIFALILAVSNSLVHASGIDMNLSASTQTTNTNEPDTTVYGSQVSSSTTTQLAPSYDATVSVGSTASISESTLSLSNILNIILIVLGILMVLFAIAILIRMRS